MMFVHEQIAQHAVERPNQPAMIHPDWTITVDLLERAVVGAANWLTSVGVARGIVLGLSLPNPLQQVVMTLACMRIGGVAAPVDFSSKGIDREDLMRRMQIRFVIGAPDSGIPPDRILAPPPLREFIAQNEKWATSQRSRADDLAVLCYGSGTTGRSKVIPLQLRHLLARCLNITDEFRPASGDKAIVLQWAGGCQRLPSPGSQDIHGRGFAYQPCTSSSNSAQNLPDALHKLWYQ